MAGAEAFIMVHWIAAITVLCLARANLTHFLYNSLEVNLDQFLAPNVQLTSCEFLIRSLIEGALCLQPHIYHNF